MWESPLDPLTIVKKIAQGAQRFTSHDNNNNDRVWKKPVQNEIAWRESDRVFRNPQPLEEEEMLVKYSIHHFRSVNSVGRGGEILHAPLPLCLLRTVFSFYTPV